MKNDTFANYSRYWAIFLLTAVLLCPGPTASGIEKDGPVTTFLLEKNLETAKGKERFDVLMKLGDAYFKESLDKGIEYYLRALNLTRTFNSPERESRVLLKLSDSYFETGNNKKAMEMAQRALSASKKTGNPKTNGEALVNIGIVYLTTGPLQKSKQYFEEALRILKEPGVKHLIATAKSGMAEFYRRSGQSDYALELHLEALKTAEEIGDTKTLTIVYNSLGVLYSNKANRPRAIKYFEAVLEIQKKNNNKNGIAGALNNVGRAYSNNLSPGKALEIFYQAMELYREVGNKVGLARTYISIGAVLNQQRKHREALGYIKKSLAIQKETRRIRGICISYYYMGITNGFLEKDILAEDFLQKGLDLALKSRDQTLPTMFFSALGRLYEKKQDYKKALKCYKRYFKDEMRLNSERITDQMAGAQARYDALNKEQRIQLLEKEKEIGTLELNREKFTRNAFIVGFILVSIILGLVFKKFLFFFTFWKKQKYISRFRLLDEIGAGGMGTVYKAHSIRDKTETVAIKILKPEMFKDESNRQRFKQEGAIVDQLEHPNIVKIYERGDYKNRLYIAMEYLEGKQLDDVIKEEEKPDLSRCLHIMKQTADALAFIHDKNIIHRDLKPSNIMLTENDGQTDFVKLLDFGLARAKFQTRITRTGVLMGTLNYMAPEQLTDSQCSKASDIFSLGATFYELLTHQIAFPGDYPNDIMKQILDSHPVAPHRLSPGFPEHLSNMIMKMLSKNPEQRPTIKNIRAALGTIS